jgi:peptidoglycan/xylan/chitin deacetylase (PgdA/CDA1 family)
MRLLLALILLLAAWPAAAQDRPADFVTVAFHDVVDRQEDQESDATTTVELVRFFDWLKGNGWNPVSLDDIDAAQRGIKPLPPKAILISFDDGYASVYTRAYPLLLAYRYPAIVAVVGQWMAGTPGSMVEYGDKTVPRERFLSWDQAREMTASGLVEIASHSFSLHESVRGNPQGNIQPAGATWRYDPASGTYEDDAAYRGRVRADLEVARQQIQQHLGKPPRALVWPFGRFTEPGIEEARATGFTFIFALVPAPDRLDLLDQIGRVYPVAGDKLRNVATEIQFEPPRAETIRIACLTLDRLAAIRDPAAQDAALGRMIEAVRALGANTLVLDAQAKLPSADAPLGAVFFPTRVRPLAADVLGRVVWQMRTRADIDTVYLHLPFAAAHKAVSGAEITVLYGDLFRYAGVDGMALDATPQIMLLGADATAQPSSTRWDVAARRRMADPAVFSGVDAGTWDAYRAAVAIKPQLKLMLIAQAPVTATRWPAPLADILLLPPSVEAGGVAHWLEPKQSGRVALTLPAGSSSDLVDTMRAAQRQGATAFALCPGDPVLDLEGGSAATLSHAFSSATYPLKP